MANSVTTQNLVEVAEVKNEILLLKGGSIRVVIEASAINFELRSEDEQMGLLQNFQRFLNSVDFPIQIIVQSRKMEIKDYLEYIQEQSSGLDELLKIQATEYGRFVKELSGLANIMSKKFYIAVPFYIYENPQKVGVIQGLKSAIRPRKTVKNITDEQLDTYRSQVLQRSELVFDGLVSLGLKTRLLKGEELIKVLYGFYNPGDTLSNIPKE